MANTLGFKGLWHLREELAGSFAAVDHTHAAGDITSGTLAAARLPVVPVTKGGTGATTKAAALTSLGAAAAEHSHTTVNGHTVESDVPAGAVFTDTVYTHPSYTARTGKPTANQTPGFGATFALSQIVSDATGHVTGATDRTVKIPDTAATQSAAGLMSAADKTKLDGIDSGAQVNSVTGVKGDAESSYRVGNVNLTAANVGAAASGHTHSYLPLSGGTLTGGITFDFTSQTPAAGANVNLITAKYKNSDGSQTHTVYPIGILGNDATANAFNSGVRLGSTNGTTVLAAGESSTTFAAALAKYNDENIYLVADGSVVMYRGVANDSSTYTGPWTVGGFTGTPTSGQVMIADGTLGGYKTSGYTIAASVPSGAKFTDTVYTHPTTAGNKHIPSGGSSGQILRWSADGTAAWGADNNTTYSAGTGLSLSGTTINHANAVTAGTAGTSSATSGSTLAVPWVTYDAQGHVTASGTHTHTISGFAAAEHSHSDYATLTDVTEKIDEIEIGGRNYAVTSTGNVSIGTTETRASGVTATLTGASTLRLSGTASTIDWFFSSRKVLGGIEFDVGTYAVWCSSDNVVLRVGYGADATYLRAMEGTKSSPYIWINQTKQIYWFTPYAKIGSSFTDEEIHIVVERGNKATDWTPAPEDKADVDHSHTTVNGHTVESDVPAGAKFTDTTYTAATAAPGNVASTGSAGTSANYARQDHTHGISLATGDNNGQVKIAGTNVAVKGLGTAAYKAESYYQPSITRKTASTTTAKSIASATTTSMLSVSITAGTWLVLGFARMNGSDGKFFKACLSSSTSWDNNTESTTVGASTNAVAINPWTEITVAATTTIYLLVYHNVGSAVDCGSARLKAYKMV
ncbi:MAG: hypothetical protein ACOX8R_02670 [Bacillota bacterium]|jgi:hypothetical protein